LCYYAAVFEKDAGKLYPCTSLLVVLVVALSVRVFVLWRLGESGYRRTYPPSRDIFVIFLWKIKLKAHFSLVLQLFEKTSQS
jgi:hypothetical protein